MKLFMVVFVLEKGKVCFDIIINCVLGCLIIGLVMIFDVYLYGVLIVVQVIQKLFNVGMVKIVFGFLFQELWEMFDGIGFGQVFNLGFLGEVIGCLWLWKNWWLIEQVMMFYGYGILVSLV